MRVLCGKGFIRCSSRGKASFVLKLHFLSQQTPFIPGTQECTPPCQKKPQAETSGESQVASVKGGESTRGCKHPLWEIHKPFPPRSRSNCLRRWRLISSSSFSLPTTQPPSYPSLPYPYSAPQCPPPLSKCHKVVNLLVPREMALLILAPPTANPTSTPCCITRAIYLPPGIRW